MIVRRRAHRRAGFTMLEMLVALAILSLVMGASTQLLRPPSPKLRVESAARALCSALRVTHSRAVAMNKEAQVIVDLARKVYSTPIAAETSLPFDTAIHMDVAQGQQANQTAAILFFPDGTSTGGDISIDIAGNRASINVNWLTGETSCAVG